VTQGPTNRVLATIGSGPAKPVLDEALPRMRAFAERHGYDLAIGQGESHGRPPAWAKIPFMQRLQTRYDLVLWIDADALFVDVSEDLPRLPEDAVQAMVPHFVQGEEVPNTGVWLVRGGDAGARYLEDVWSRDQWTHHPWWEQAAVLDAMGYENVAREQNVLTPETPCRPGRPSEWRDATSFLGDEWNVLYHHLDFVTVRPRVLHYAYMGGPERVHQMKLEMLKQRIDGVEDEHGQHRVRKAALRAKYWSVTSDAPVRAASSRPGRLAVKLVQQAKPRTR